MRDIPAENATSRYKRGIYICSGCGVREALEGEFWDANYPFSRGAIFQQSDWRLAHDDGAYAIDPWRRDNPIS